MVEQGGARVLRVGSGPYLFLFGTLSSTTIWRQARGSLLDDEQRGIEETMQ